MGDNRKNLKKFERKTVGLFGNQVVMSHHQIARALFESGLVGSLDMAKRTVLDLDNTKLSRYVGKDPFGNHIYSYVSFHETEYGMYSIGTSRIAESRSPVFGQ